MAEGPSDGLNPAHVPRSGGNSWGLMVTQILSKPAWLRIPLEGSAGTAGPKYTMIRRDFRAEALRRLSVNGVHSTWQGYKHRRLEGPSGSLNPIPVHDVGVSFVTKGPQI